jgi:hypothetical protein
MRNLITSGIDPLDVWHPRLNAAERASLIDLLRSRKAADQKRFEDWFHSMNWRGNYGFIDDIADELICNPRFRWMFCCGMWPARASHPEAIWRIVRRWGGVPHRDIRLAVGVCLLEELLGLNFDCYFERVARLIQRGESRFAYTLSVCQWNMPQPDQIEYQRGCIIDVLRPFKFAHCGWTSTKARALLSEFRSQGRNAN